MKWQDVAKKLTIPVGVVALFAALFLLTGLDATYTEDITCNTTCESYINVTTTYWRVCFAHYDTTQYQDETLFKKRTRSRTLHVNLDHVENIIETDPEIEVEWLVSARGAGNWRPLKDGDCWERGKVNKIKLVGHKEPWQTVKWSFMLGDKIDIDPEWKGIKYPHYGCDYRTVYDEENIYHYKDVYDPINDTTKQIYDYTETIQKPREECIPGTKRVVFGDEVINFQKEHKYCTIEGKTRVVCDDDSHGDGNGDGICQSGETCYVYDIKDKIGLKSIKNGVKDITHKYKKK